MNKWAAVAITASFLTGLTDTVHGNEPTTNAQSNQQTVEGAHAFLRDMLLNQNFKFEDFTKSLINPRSSRGSACLTAFEGSAHDTFGIATRTITIDWSTVTKVDTSSRTVIIYGRANTSNRYREGAVYENKSDETTLSASSPDFAKRIYSAAEFLRVRCYKEDRRYGF